MSPDVPRYLVPFHTKHVPHFFADVLIVGSGLAGLRAALAVDPGLSVVVVAKQSVEHSNSSLAQGGIAATLDAEDSFEEHDADTLRAGVSLCDPAVVEQVVREAPAHIEELIRWGVRFDREGDRLALAREGGHGKQRIVHALGDASGKEIMRAMIRRAREAANIEIWENTFTLDLLTLDGV
ncbi:MAG: FAD-binding protein, partial [Pirellulales bacterium]|nr:FAD-binding protein [Pirellulales bacterium]